MKERRLANVRITPELLTMVLSGAGEIIKTDVPVGAEVVGAGYDIDTRHFYMTLEHESFMEVPEGQMMPTLWNITYTIKRDG